MKDPVGLGRSPTWVVLLLVGVSVTLIPMALTGPAVALPGIARDLHADVGALQWVVNGYNLTFAAFMLARGRSQTGSADGGSTASGRDCSGWARWCARWRARSW